MPGPRVALLGIALESNRQSPVARRADFERLCWLEGPAILADARSAHPRIAAEVSGFVRTMDATGPWEPVPILFAASHPHGPIDGALLDDMLDRIGAELTAARPLDAVYVANHGGMIATDRDDADGDILALARETAGGRVVATLDLHANISARMVEAADLIVGYRTNPHVDMLERGEEAALALRLMLAGEAEPKAAMVRLPIAAPTVALLTAEGPYGAMIDLGQRRRAEMGGAILNVSVFGGFVFSDTEKAGLTTIVTARRERALAAALAEEIAALGWAGRQGFVKPLAPVSRAIEIALDGARPPVILADLGDNPGGGGTGRTTELISALVWAGAEDVLIGAFFDPALARQAHAAGVGATITAHFNTEPGLSCDAPFSAEASVLALADGDAVGRLGLYQGRTMRLGRSAALRIGGVTAVVISERYQTADPVIFERLGLDIGTARTAVVKSRGHFRAGFRPWFSPEQVVEVDTAGLTSSALDRRQWHHLPRPIFPLDPDTRWPPAEDAPTAAPSPRGPRG